MAKSYTCAETAKLVRKALAKEFPGTKFSTRSKVYSMGASIDVSWTDGPRSKRVDPIIKPFEGASFDGMQDLKSYQHHVVNGEEVDYGADYVFGNRHISGDFNAKVEEAKAMIKAGCMCEGAEGQERFGNQWISDLARNMVYDRDESETLEVAFQRVVLRN